MTKLVGITGRKYHGKDTVAQELALQGYVRLGFADALKAMLRGFYEHVGEAPDIIDRKLDGDLKEEPCPHLCGRTPRHAMQTLGTEWGRVCIGEDLWVQALTSAIQRHGKVVVPDVRFANECDAIKAAGGVVARVDASERVPDGPFSDHASEREVASLPVDAVIPNNGSRFALSCAVKFFAENCLGS